MAITTFAELKTALANWQERSDLTDRLGEFIALGESEIKADLAGMNMRLREMETRDDLTPASGECTLPTDYMAMIKVQARTSSPRRLEYKSRDWLDESYPDGAEGDPVFYTIVGGSLYMFPLTTSDIRIDYYAYPAALSDAQTTNWLLTKYPNVYLWQTLKQFAAYEKDTDSVAYFNGLYQEALGKLTSAAFGAAITPGTSRTATVQAY